MSEAANTDMENKITHLFLALRNPFHVVVPVSLDHLLEVPTVNTILDCVTRRKREPAVGGGVGREGGGRRIGCLISITLGGRRSSSS